jgi:rare lipoprotein A
MRFLVIFGLIFVLSGCSIFRGEEPAPTYKIGNPYKIKGIWYYPQRDLTYDETGIASWYGDKFKGRPTANGEIFDPTIVSAAHKTLPLPTVVRVINLENGRSLVVRINDRGPFVHGRIIDMSREGARLLGFQKNGVARVRVQVVADESLRLEQAAKAGSFPEAITGNKPAYRAASVPSVSIKPKASQDGAVIDRGGAVSSIDLVRNVEVIPLAPVRTNIWIQVGAFSQIANAEAVVTRLEGVGPVAVSTFDSEGLILHRVRIGPIADVKSADSTLATVYKRGFDGAKIILE